MIESIPDFQRRRLMAMMLSGALTAPAAANASMRSVFPSSNLAAGITGSVVGVPQLVVDAVKAATNVGRFNVSSNTVFTGSILKCDELIFGQNAVLTMMALTERRANFVVIAAKEWHFSYPKDKSVIQRDPAVLSLQGPNGGTGGAGQDGVNDGDPGGPGYHGYHGQVGSFNPMAQLYLMGENVEFPVGGPYPLKLAFHLPGIAGGPGGNGGIGGRGGNGHQGSTGSDYVLGCKGGPGEGGRGGIGGIGGDGGHGGRGADGGSILVCGPTPFQVAMKDAEVINEFGPGGPPGIRGTGGLGGSGSKGGGTSTYCQTIHPQAPNGPTGPFGFAPVSNGPDGQKGSIFISPRNNLDDFY